MPAQIKLSDWEIFEVLGEVGSFRKASEILRLDSANIKRSVDKLEPTLNLRLFNRTPRGVKLTEEGQSYQYKIKELMSRSPGLASFRLSSSFAPLSSCPARGLGSVRSEIEFFSSASFAEPLQPNRSDINLRLFRR